MKRVNLDTAAPGVKKFLRSLPVDAEGIELALGNLVLWKLVPPAQLSHAAKAALLARGRELIRRARQGNQGVPASVIAREVRQAVQEVRRRKQR